MTDTDGNRRQLRFALSMNGGVSLAVWIGGAVTEIDFVRRDDKDDRFWGDLLEACGYQRRAVVDVMAGASAGGLNAVLLAQAIRCGRPFKEFEDVWLKSADIERLVKPPRRARQFDDRAVGDGTYFLRRLYDTLETAKQRAAAEGTSDQTHDLEVFASATLVQPNQVAFTDVPGSPIREARSDAYFHIARRGTASRGLDGFASPADVLDSTLALAMIGRATSSLPGLFEPVTFHNDEGTRTVVGPPVFTDPEAAVPAEQLDRHFGSRLVDAFRRPLDPAKPETISPIPPVQVMDGGVVDNVPISRAIRAIYDSPASGRVRRVLLYLHPDPGGDTVIDIDTDTNTDTKKKAKKTKSPPDSFLGVVMSFGGKRAEAIREDIELLRRHNDAVDRRADTARALLFRLEGATTAQAEEEGTTTDALELMRRRTTLSTLVRAAVDPASQLSWHAAGATRLEPLIDRPGGLAKAAVEADLRRAVFDCPGLLIAERTERATHAIVRVIRDGMAVNDDYEASEALELLNELALWCQLVTAWQLNRMLRCDTGPGASSTTLPGKPLRSAHDELASWMVGTAPTDLDAQWTALATWAPLPSSPTTDPHTLPADLTRRLGDALTELKPPSSAVQSQAHRLLRWLTEEEDGIADPARRIERACLIEEALLPLAAEPIASDQRIDFVRIAGDVVTPSSLLFMAGDAQDTRGHRIAGKQLHHLGAFFARRWRVNDLHWGRLDAVPGLLDAILDPIALDRLGAAIANAPAAGPHQNSVVAMLVKRGAKQQLDPATIRQWLLEHRDRQLRDRLAPGEKFDKWRKDDRRIASLLGSRPLTATGVKATVTLGRVLTHRQKSPWRQVLDFARLPMLAAAGLVLAGRMAAVALAWSVCALAAPRTRTDAGGWALLGVGVGLVGLIAYLVERKVRPDPAFWRCHVPYLLTVSGIVAGAVVLSDRDRLRADVPWIGVSWAWVFPAVSATIAAVALFFWMRWWAMAPILTVVFGWYGWIAYLGARVASDNPVSGWPTAWPFHSMWLAWMLAVYALAWVTGCLPDGAFLPGRPRGKNDDEAR